MPPFVLQSQLPSFPIFHSPSILSDHPTNMKLIFLTVCLPAQRFLSVRLAPGKFRFEKDAHRVHVVAPYLGEVMGRYISYQLIVGNNGF